MNERDVTDVLSLHNKYSLVKGVARRARQLQSGAMPLVPATSMKACRVAEDEFRNGHVRYVVPPTAKLNIPPSL